jgi:hypothetical protein
MTTGLLAAAYITAPVVSGVTPTDATVAAGDPQRLAGTGATGAENSIALPMSRYATLKVAATAVRVRFGATAPEADTTDVYLAAGESFAWYVEQSSQFVSVQAADGAAAYEAHVWCSSPKVS